MEAFALLDDAQQRRLVFLARLLAHCKPIEPSGEGGGSPADGGRTRKEYTMGLIDPPTVQAQGIILAQMERLDKLAENWFKTENNIDTMDLVAISKSMAELNRELYRMFPAPAYPPPFHYPQSAD